GVSVVCYDGSATHPGTDALWRLAEQAGVTYFGTGAPYLVTCMKAGLRPAAEHDLSRLRGIGSAGSPPPPQAVGEGCCAGCRAARVSPTARRGGPSATNGP